MLLIYSLRKQSPLSYEFMKLMFLLYQTLRGLLMYVTREADLNINKKCSKRCKLSTSPVL